MLYHRVTQLFIPVLSFCMLVCLKPFQFLVFLSILCSRLPLFRFMSIVYPVYHRNYITKKKVLIIIIILNSLFSTFLVVSFFWEGLSDLLVVTAFSGNMTFIAGAYRKIFLISSRRSNVVSPESVEESITSSERKRKRTFLKDIKLAKSCFLVVICYFMCFIPGPLTYIW